jgi:hypothetical protein
MVRVGDNRRKLKNKTVAVIADRSQLTLSKGNLISLALSIKLLAAESFRLTDFTNLEIGSRHE